MSNNYLQRRSGWLALTFTAVALCVLGLSAQRLQAPMSDTHQAPRSGGSVVTLNPFRGAVGGVVDSAGRRVLLEPDEQLNARELTAGSTRLLRDVVASKQLADALEPALRRGMTDFVRATADSARLGAGRRLLLTLDERLQALLQRDSLCFTGVLTDCAGLPETLRNADARLRDPARGPRAGMAAVVVVHEDSGQILAMSGALADCVAHNLRRKVDPSGKQGRRIFAGDEDVCPQFPDARHGELIGLRITRQRYQDAAPGADLSGLGIGLARHPALLSLPPGSTGKVELAAGCARTERFGASAEVVRAKYAASSDNDWFKELALRCADGYRNVFLDYAQPIDILWPARVLVRREEFAGWSLQPTPATLPTGALLSPEEFRAMEDATRRPTTMRPKLAPSSYAKLQRSRDLASIAIGGGGHSASLFAHARTMRALGASSRGQSRVPGIHLVRDLDDPLEIENQQWVGEAATSRIVLDLLTGVTALGGTAHSACRRVEGHCPVAGLGIQGKTGTGDFSSEQGSDLVKKGERFPAKLVVLRFEVRGQWFIVAAHAFRTRDPATGKLDESNPAAELALLARRHLIAQREP
ncbi:MAG: hypothetical protein ABL900_07195 [Burkholderiaceae bacterium]